MESYESNTECSDGSNVHIVEFSHVLNREGEPQKVYECEHCNLTVYGQDALQ